MDSLKDLRGQLDAGREKLAAIFAQAKVGTDEANGNPIYDLSKAESLTGDTAARVEQVQKLNDELSDIQAKVKGAEAAQSQLAEIGRNVEDLDKPIRPAGLHPSGGRPALEQAPLSIGEMFVQSKAYKDYKPGDLAGGPSAHFDVPAFSTLFQTSAGWAPESLRTGRVELLPLAPAPSVIGVFPEIPTSQAAVKYMEETTHTNNAAEVNEGSTYGESVFVLTERTSTVRKIGVWIPVTDEQLEDVDQVSAYLNQRLPYQLAFRLDGQGMQGDGTAPNVLGTENVTGIQTQALGTDPLFDAAFKLFRKIRDNGFAEPSAFFIAPSKWETVALTRTSDGIYILGNPANDVPTRLWGVPGQQTTRCTSTKLVAGAYDGYSALYVRRGVDVQIGYQNDDFIKGRLAIRADVRITPVHYRPKAFGTVTGL